MSISATDISGRNGGSMDALSLLADPEKLKKRIESFNSAEAAAREQIALAGPASEIVAIRGSIDADREAAQVALNTAMAEADGIVKTASETALGIVKDAEEDADKVEANAAEILKQAQARSAGATTEQAVVNREREVLAARKSEQDHRDSALQQKADDLDKREQELDGEKDKLAEVRELINNIL